MMQNNFFSLKAPLVSRSAKFLLRKEKMLHVLIVLIALYSLSHASPQDSIVFVLGAKIILASSELPVLSLLHSAYVLLLVASPIIILVSSIYVLSQVLRSRLHDLAAVTMLIAVVLTLIPWNKIEGIERIANLSSRMFVVGFFVIFMTWIHSLYRDCSLASKIRVSGLTISGFVILVSYYVLISVGSI